jgi:hypothetical protein
MASLIMPSHFEDQRIQDLGVLDIDIRKFQKTDDIPDPFLQSSVFHLTFLFSDHSIWRAAFASGKEHKSLDDTRPGEAVSIQQIYDFDGWIKPPKRPLGKSFIVADEGVESKIMSNHKSDTSIMMYGRDRFVEDRMLLNDKLIKRPFFNMQRTYKQLLDLKIPVSSTWRPDWDLVNASTFSAIQNRFQRVSQRAGRDPSATM